MSARTYQVRPGLESDAHAVSALVSKLSRRFIANELSEDGRATLLRSMTPDSVLGYLRADHRFLLAESEAQVIGVIAERLPAHLFYLFVDEGWHHCGVARDLWNRLREGTRYEWTVNASRYAQRAYERLGFHAVGSSTERGGVVSIPMLWSARPASAPP